MESNVTKFILMDEDGNNLYDASNCGYYADPEATDTEAVILDGNSYRL